jgi:hypothetical protein
VRAAAREPEALGQREERGGVGRGGRALAQAVPRDLLAQGAGDLDERLVVQRVLVERQELRGQHVLERHDADGHGEDLHLVAALDDLVGDGSCRGTVDEVDHDVAVPRLDEPLLRRALRAEALLVERGERAVDVLGRIMRSRSFDDSGPPRAQAATLPPSRNGHLGRAQGVGGLLRVRPMGRTTRCDGGGPRRGYARRPGG